MFVLKKQSFSYLTDKQKKDLEDFVKVDIKNHFKPLKIFQMNRRSFVCSDQIQAQGFFEQDEERQMKGLEKIFAEVKSESNEHLTI